MNKWKAAKEGSKEIYFAVISTSITLAVVFLPIIFPQVLPAGYSGVWRYCGSWRCINFVLVTH